MRAKAYVQLHVCVFLWGFTAILGKLISLPAHALVWWRMALVTGLLALWPFLWRQLARIPLVMQARFLGIGAVVAAHWLTFYAAIKWSNASVAATCMALGSVFTALIEPWLTGKRWVWQELLVGVLGVPGIALLVGGIPTVMHVGLATGIVSAALTALFTVLNKRYTGAYPALAVTGLEMAGGLLALTAVAAFLPPTLSPLAWPNPRDFALLLVLATACTLLPFALSLVALRSCSAFSVQLAINLEPVYAVLLAIALLNEQRELSAAFYWGALWVVAIVMLQPLWLQRRALRT